LKLVASRGKFSEARIRNAMGSAFMTSSLHLAGTDRGLNISNGGMIVNALQYWSTGNRS
jgi:hypothetical protein